MKAQLQFLNQTQIKAFSMWSDIFQLIPQNLKQKALDTLVDVVSDQAKKYVGEGVSGKVKKLRSDAAFHEAFEAGLSRAIQRFIEEYQVEDEDLVLAISKERDFFQNKEIQTALIAMLKQPGASLIEEREEILQTFSTVLPERINRKRVDRAVSYLLKCLAQELWHLPELMPIYSLQFHRIAAEAAREQVNLQKAQLQTLTSLNVGIRDALLTLTDAIVEQKLLSAGGTTDSPSYPKVLHNLPQPDFEEFIGREKEQTQIHELLQPYPHSRHYLIVIDGIGGIGKSALALEIAHQYLRNYNNLPPEGRFEAIIWISAKSNLLTADGIVSRRQIMRSLDDIYTAIAIALQREDITRARQEEQNEIVRQALTQQRTLLVIDNFETIDDENVLSFLRELPDPTKAIVTTRHRIDIAYPIRLVGMPLEEGIELIAHECSRKSVSLTEEEERLLYRRTGGVPLALVWSIAQMGFGHTTETVLNRLGQPSSDIALFCFKTAAEYIRGTNAHLLLLALSIFSSSASREVLGYMTQLPEIDRDEGLVILEKLSLINKLGHRFQMLPLTLTYANSELAAQSELEASFRERWIDFLLQYITDQRLTGYQLLEKYQLEAPNIADVIDWCWQAGRLNHLITFIDEFDGFLWRSGDWNVLIQYYELGLQAATLLEDEIQQAKFLRMQANIRDFQGDLVKAEQLLADCLNIAKQYEDEYEIVQAVFRLTSIQTKQNKFDLARSNAYEALEIAQRLDYIPHIIRMKARLGMIDIKDNNLDSAKKHFQEALELRVKMKKYHPPESNVDAWLFSWIFRWLGWLELKEENFQLADEYIQQALETAYLAQSPQDVAETKRHLAQLQLATGLLEMAQQTASEAIELFTKLGMKQQLQETLIIVEVVQNKLN
ncbi:MAG: AAA family ATPase [Ardenticatenaceae bacterium]|nr:AAA family ATPase [Ardenticatenaceae bacterium]